VARSRRHDRDLPKPNPKRKIRVRSEPQKVKGLVNARLLAFEFPDTFELPHDSVIKSVKPGDYVKVARNGERFWLRVDGFVGRRWHGTVDNDLVVNEDIERGDSIYFMRKNIYDVMKA